MSNAIDWPYAAPQSMLIDMAEEKLLQDADTFTDWLAAECMEPTEIRPSKYFAPISTKRLLAEVMAKQGATKEQLAEGWLEIKRRYLADNQETVTSEFQRLQAQS